jgi:hypothetical protein
VKENVEAAAAVALSTKRQTANEQATNIKATPPRMVVCATAPYMTSVNHEKKHLVTKTMANEFVRYYLRLGFRVIFYDRAGGHMSPQLKQQLAESEESQKSPNTEDREYFVCKNFTMLEALVSTANPANNKVRVKGSASSAATVRSRPQYYDNTEERGSIFQCYAGYNPAG